MECGKLFATRLGQGIAWLYRGTHDSLLDAANFIATIEKRQGLKIACLEEIALRNGNITPVQFRELVEGLPQSSYRDYLEGFVTGVDPAG